MTKCNDITEEKRLLRTSMRAALRRMSRGERESASAAACAALLTLKSIEDADTILAYMAMPSEIDPAAAVSKLVAAEKRVAFPVCMEGNLLALYIPKTPDAFAAGKYGILEPKPSESTLIAPSELDCIIVPGIAFDANRRRLGQGAGYYDRLLSRCKAKKIGFAFEMQMTATVPTDERDVKMDAVVTEKGIYC